MRSEIHLVARFGIFEADFRSGELHKNGIKLPIQQQPLQVLQILLERPGDVVTREELREAIWPADTFVGFDVGLDAAVYKLRQALGDSAENPRFVETLPRRGYRFIAPVTRVEEQGRAAGHGHRGPSEEPTPKSTAAASSPERAATPLYARHRWGIAVAIAAVASLAVAAAAWRASHRTSGSNYVIAVLPFKNLGPETTSDYFSDGLTDEIIRNLSLIEGLEVKSRTSSFAFKNKPRDIPEVRAELQASLVLEGSVYRSGSRLRINAQLVRTVDDVTLWSGRYDREMKDVFAIQDEISRSIVNELRLKNVGGQRRYNANLEAYDLYLKANTLQNLRSRQYAAQIQESIGLYQQVIAKDPNFAMAYAGMVVAYANLSSAPPHFSAEEAESKMRPAAEKALELDPLLPEAHEAMGLVQARELAWSNAEAEFRRALQLNPNLAAAHLDLAAAVLHPMGRLDEAAAELRKALQLDPRSLSARRNLAYVLLDAHRYDEVLKYCREISEIDPNDFFAQQFTGRALMARGQLREAIAIFEKLGDNSQHFLGYAYVQAGRQAEARQLIGRNQDWPARQTIIYAALGDRDGAFAGLARMAGMKDPRVDVYPYFPELASLRDDRRMQEFRRARGLPWSP